MENSDVILKLEGIGKRFPGVYALKDVDFELRKGEIHALCGENGAGKSTLMKILSGVYRPDDGNIILDGKHVHFNNPKASEDAGISIVYQELSVFKYMSAAENIFVNSLPKANGVLNKKKLYEDTDELLKRFELNGIVKPTTLMKDINLAKQQIMEIIRAVSRNAKIVIFDEPTSALTEHETKLLFDIITNLKKNGTSIIYISHRLDEIFGLADRATVLRDGEYVTTLKVSESSKEELIRNMVGRNVEYDYGVGTSEIRDAVLEVRNISDGKYVKDVSFKLRKGEILGIGGLEGAGRTELVEMIFGWRRVKKGEILIDGKKVNIDSPEEAIRHGIAYITKDRKNLGLFTKLNILQNISCAGQKRFTKFGMINYTEMKKNAEEYVGYFSIKTPGLGQKVLNLSGGNQQKVLLSMWLTNEPRIIIVDEPTRGIDVGVKREIHLILRELAKKGNSIIMISSDLPELLAASDNILVLYEGATTGYINYKEASEEKVARLASNG